MKHKEVDGMINVTNAFTHEFTDGLTDSTIGSTTIVSADSDTGSAVEVTVDSKVVKPTESLNTDLDTVESSQANAMQDFVIPERLYHYRDLLIKGLCLICMEFEDGSKVESITTLHTLILDKCGIKTNLDAEHLLKFGLLYDLETKLPIPREYLKYIVDCKSSVSKSVQGLDKFLEIGGKFWWNNTKTFSSHRE